MGFDIRSHYNSRASDWDGEVFRLVPYLNEMLDAVTVSIPFSVGSNIKVVDLGCGTGLLTERIIKKFPNAAITCVDISEDMINCAKAKLDNYDQCISYILSDFNGLEFESGYDLVISSLALHHLESDQDKIRFYSKIYNCLNPGGAFYNLDTVLGSTPQLNEEYMIRWKQFIHSQGRSDDFIENVFIPNIKEEDHPAKLLDHLRWLSDVGFMNIDVVWKQYSFAVYGAMKSQCKDTQHEDPNQPADAVD